MTDTPTQDTTLEELSKMYIKLLVALNHEKAKNHKMKEERLEIAPIHRSILWSVVMMLDRDNVKGATETLRELLKPL